MQAPAATALIYDVAEYRRRKALRDCGRGSRSQRFLWVDPRSGTASVAVFRPSTPTASAALRMAGRRAG